MDFIKTNGSGGMVLNGSVAQRLGATGFSAHALRPYIGTDGKPYVTQVVNGELKAVPFIGNATLKKDEWKTLDQALLEARQRRMVGISDLESRGLVYNIPNGMGTTVLEWEDISDMNDAEVNMDGQNRAQNDRVEYDLSYLPLPITHKDFTIGARVLESSRTRGLPLDTTQVQLSALKVAEKLESYLFIGSGSYTYGGGTIYGYMTHPDRNTGSLTAHWDDSAATGETMLDDIRAMKQALISARFYGPYGVYVPTNFETALDGDFKAGSDKSIRQRLLEVGGIEFIKVSDFLTADNVIMVQLTSDVVRIVNAMEMTTVEWDQQGGMILNYKVMAIKVPNLRSDQNDRCGVAHYTL